MPNIVGNGVLKATRARAIHDGKIFSYSESILVPSGTLFASGNVMRFFRIDPSKTIPLRIIYDQSGNLDGHAVAATRTLTGTAGYILSANRAGTNLSLTAAGGAATTQPAGLIAAAQTAVVGSVASQTFGNDDGTTALLQNGGVGIYNPVVAILTDPRGYDASVMDVAVTFTGNSSTATTTDIYCTLTLEFMGIGRSPTGGAFLKPYTYTDRYDNTTQQSS